MTQSSNKDTKPAKTNDPKVADAYNRSIGPPDLARLRANFEDMKLIPWRDIWKSLSVAKIRGNGKMIEVFYDTLFKDAVFDDRGALVQVLVDAEEAATIGQYRTPPVIWSFTDSRGARVPRGDYRIYLSAGEDFLSFSDVAVP